MNECKIASNTMLNKLMKHFKSEFDVWWISAGSINKYFVIACQNWWIVFLLHQWHDLWVWLEYQMCSCAPPHLAGTERVFAWRIFYIIRHVSFTRKLKCDIWLLHYPLYLFPCIWHWYLDLDILDKQRMWQVIWALCDLHTF